MAKNTKKLCFLITAFNQQEYIYDTVNSCIDQCPSNIDYEIVVINDGSSDNTLDVLLNINNNLLTIISHENVGIEKSLNTALVKIDADFICRVDGDDKIDHYFLRNIQDYLESNNHIIYGDYHVIDSNSQIVQTHMLPDFQKDELIERGDFLATGTVFSKFIYDKVGGYDEKVKNSGLENYQFIIKAFLMNTSFIHINKVLFFYRKHATNLSLTKKTSILKIGQDFFNQQGLGCFQFGEHHPWSHEHRI